jgi:hypothetical protein
MYVGESTCGLASVFDDKPSMKKAKWKRRAPVRMCICDECGTYFEAVNNEKRCSKECREEANAKRNREFMRRRHANKK